MTAPREVMVAGERLSDLVAALRDLKFGERGANGMTSISGVIGPAATRAMMRIEARFLIEDADSPPPYRTPEQRCSDALVQLAEDVASSLMLHQVVLARVRR